MRIKTLIVIDENGVEHRWEGHGSISPERSRSKLGEPYVKEVTAQIILDPEPIKPTPEPVAKDGWDQ